MDTRNFHQSPEEIIKGATPEEKLIWNQIFLLGGDRLTISQLYYCGAVAGTDFLTYRARRLFLAYTLNYSATITGAANVKTVTFYNELDIINFVCHNLNIIWNATAAAPNYHINDGFINNIYFSRLAIVGPVYIKFIGYRITY